MKLIGKLLVGAGVLGATVSMAAPAGAITWIRVDADTIQGTEPGSDQPCDRTAGSSHGARAEVVNGTCWILLPEESENANFHAVDEWDEQP